MAWWGRSWQLFGIIGGFALGCGELDAGAPVVAGDARSEDEVGDLAVADPPPRDAAPSDPRDAGARDTGARDAGPATDADPSAVSDAGAPDASPDPCAACADTCRAGVCGRLVNNPVLAGDHPDPDVMRIDDGEPTWQRSEHEPPPFTTGFTSFYCDEDATVLIGVGPDQGRELVHSATDDAWTVRDSNFVELTGTAELPRGWDQRVARSPDGRTEFVVLATPDERRLVSRTDDGPWVDMARSPTVVFATDEGVYAFDHTTDTDLVRIWPAG